VGVAVLQARTAEMRVAATNIVPDVGVSDDERRRER